MGQSNQLVDEHQFGRLTAAIMSSKAPSSNRSSAVVAGSYKVRPVGALHTLDYRIFLENEQGDRVSPFHDVPLWANEAEGILNMIVEIPRCACIGEARA